MIIKLDVDVDNLNAEAAKDFMKRITEAVTQEMFNTYYNTALPGQADVEIHKVANRGHSVAIVEFRKEDRANCLRRVVEL